MAQSRIEWTEYSWNPVTGCTPISEACEHCYAARMAKRLAGRCGYPADEPFRVTLHPERLFEPLKWKEPRKVFVCSMGDLFHPYVPDDFLFCIFSFITHISVRHHTFIILTKRPERAKQFICSLDYQDWGIPWKNVWLGVTTENQQRAEERIPILLQIPAAVRFVSIEPMLGPIELRRAFGGEGPRHTYIEQVDWVICGGETGPGARPMHPRWVRSLRDQCQEAGVPFFFKSWGDFAPCDNYSGLQKPVSVISLDGQDDGMMTKVGKKKAGRMLDGRTWDETPKE